MLIQQLESDYREKYIYRGEGNANLVISLPLKRSVLRFRKITTANVTRSDDGKTRVKYEWKFFSEFISKYMGTFVTQPEVIQCHPRDFEHWQEIVEAHRPEHRKQMNLYEDLAIKLPDYTQLPEYLDVDTGESTFCIEIKPKQGFSPQSDRHVQCCTFCINQFHKMERKTIREASTYCPCDLFSGDKIRAKRAIISLIKSPQNNFMLFEDGNVTWGEGHCRDDLNGIFNRLFQYQLNDNRTMEDAFCQLIIEALFRKFPIDDINKEFRNSLSKAQSFIRESRQLDSVPDVIHRAAEKIKVLNKSCDFSSSDLPEGSVLECLLSMQKLHFSSTSYVYELFSKYSSLLNEEMIYFPNNYKCNGNNINFNDIQTLRNYLLFSTARDCSILIALRKIDEQKASKIPREHVITLPNDNGMFVFNIGLTDLDPKPLKCIEKHYQRIINGLNSIINN